MDTPSIPAPKDSREVALLSRLSIIRDKLLLLKQDRTTYIRSQDVIPLYDQVIEQVKELNDIRAETGNHEENRRKHHPCTPCLGLKTSSDANLFLGYYSGQSSRKLFSVDLPSSILPSDATTRPPRPIP